MGQVASSHVVVGSDDAFYSLIFDDDSGGFLSKIRNNKLQATFDINNRLMHYGSMGQRINDNFGPEDNPYTLRPSQDNRYMLSSSEWNQRVVKDLPFREFRHISGGPVPGFIMQGHTRTDLNTHLIVSICDVNLTQNTFSFQTWSAENSKTAKNAYLADWLMFGDAYNKNTQLMDGKFFGSQALKQSASNMVSIDLKHCEFGAKHMLLVTVRKTDCSDLSQYVTSVTSLDASSASIAVARVDANGARSTDLQLDWIAWDPSAAPNSKTSVSATLNVSIPSTSNLNKTLNVNISVSGDFIVNEPVVLTQVGQEKSASDARWLTTAVANNAEFFTLSLLNMADSSGDGSKQLSITYWAFERIIVK